jgi:Acetyltransferase (GNAT) domain
MNASGDQAATVRRARAEDVEPNLDLLAYYERPRSYFEPFYLKDPSYRPDQSWVAEEDGCLVAHIRVFDRSIRVGGTELRVAALGNLITAPDQRGRGHAGTTPGGHTGRDPGRGFPLLAAQGLPADPLRALWLGDHRSGPRASHAPVRW